MQKQLEILKKILDKIFFLALAGYFLFSSVFVIAAEMASNIKYLVRFDVAILDFIIKLRIGPLTEVLNIFTNLGDIKIMILLTIVVAMLFFLRERYIYSISIALSIGIAEFTSFMLKNIIDRRRPPEFINLVYEGTASFPSGHTIAAITFYGFLIYFFYKNMENKIWRNILILLCTVIILFAGFARIYLGAHWPSDVLAGYILGGTWLIIIIWLIEKKRENIEG